MDEAIDDLDALVEELIEYVRMGNTELSRPLETIPVHELFEELIAKYQVLFPRIVWEIEIAPSDDSSALHANRSDALRALGNLICNAARYAKERVVLRASSLPHRILIEVEDDGPGIPAGDRQRAWDPFVRLDAREEASKRAAGTGVGLGLAIVKRIVERYDGITELVASPTGGCVARTTWPSTSAKSP